MLRMSQVVVSLLLAVLLVPNFAIAQEQPAKFTNESELGVVMVSGNARTQTYNVRQLNSYLLNDLDKMKFDGRYLRGLANDVETAKNWAASLRYERELSEWYSLYAQQAQESDIFAGYENRYNSDLGLKMFLTKNDSTVWFSELGYRYTAEFRTRGEPKRFSSGRLFTEATHVFNKSSMGKIWGEYLPNFTEPEDYMINGEASISAVLSDIFSIKTGYLFRYRNLLIGNATTRIDSTVTTSLVAKF
jgi:putative salt-induced outer membrane protein